jgi:lipopolysaccharide transport system permease protein
MAIYADLLRYPDLFANLFRRELRVKYKGSLLGVAWTLVNPLVLMGVYTLVFSILWRAVSIRHYPLFVLSGLAVWIFFQGSLQMASVSLLGHANLVKQVRFPRQLLPLAVVATNLVTFAVMLLVLVPLNLAFVPDTRSTVWAVVPLALPLVAVVSGLSIIGAAVTVIFRDVEHLLTTVLLPWFFLTPIFYELGQLPGFAKHPALVDLIHYGNFLTPLVQAIRDPLFFGRMPDAIDVVYAVAAGIVALALGALVFRRVDDQLAVQL